MLLVIVFFVVQQQFENHVLVPKVMERQVGVSAVTVIVALLIGGNLLGIAGAILAVPTAAILQVLFSEWMLSRDGAPPDPVPQARKSSNSPRPLLHPSHCSPYARSRLRAHSGRRRFLILARCAPIHSPTLGKNSIR